MRKILLLLVLIFTMAHAGAAVSISGVGGWFESGYVTWKPMSGAATYNVYYKSESGSYIKLDDELVRNYGSYGRADAVGITAGKYLFKVVPVNSKGVEMTSSASTSALFTAKAHDRGGFAHFNYKNIGAYNDNGTLKSGARVVYVTAENAKSVKCTVAGAERTGLQGIIAAYEKGTDKTPIAIRIIGTIEASDMDYFGSTAQGIQMKGKSGYSELNITIEGIGNDAALRGFGMLIRNSKSVELRNFAVYLALDDCISFDTNNSNCWVHNIDFFYGKTGSDADQAKGDGSLDCKGNSTNMTFSYNRFWDSGKMSLCGMKSESTSSYITYHHNWFDHSDSRHPRVRTMTVHVYNNYFDGCSKYGVGATMGANIFVESNYYRNTNRPMLSSKQGTDTSGAGTFSGENGGMIKSYGNVFAEKSSKFSFITHKQSSTSFDAYEASSRSEKVSSSYKTVAGGTTYNNFDTDASKIYSYTPHAASEVPSVVTGQYGAGRMQHGDLVWSFTNSVDDASYAVNEKLKQAITNYKPSLVGFFDGSGDTGGDDGDVTIPSDGNYACSFNSAGATNSFYSITGNVSNSKGTATVGGVTYDWGLKIESSTSIKFTTSKTMTLTLVFASNTTPNIKIDGVKVSSTSGNVITAVVSAGSHTLTKADSFNLYYINLSDGNSKVAAGIEQTGIEEANEDGVIYDLYGRIVTNPKRGSIYIRNGKKFMIR